MNALAELKSLTHRVKLADEYFGKELTETQKDKALDRLQDILRDIVELTVRLESIYGKNCIDWDMVELKDSQISMGV